MVSEYKRFAAQYIALAIHTQHSKLEREESDIETNFILLYINNVLAKLMKNQELLSHFFAYATTIIMNPIFC